MSSEVGEVIPQLQLLLASSAISVYVCVHVRRRSSIVIWKSIDDDDVALVNCSGLLRYNRRGRIKRKTRQEEK